MKRLVTVCLASLVIAVSVYAEGHSTSVSTNSVKILANVEANAGQAWASTNAYTQGELVYSEGRVWMALIAGTSSTNAPSGILDYVDGTVTWRKALAQKRKGLFIGNEGSNETTISWFSALVAGSGITLAQGEKIILTEDDCPQGAIYTISDSGTNSTSTLEW